jgi:DNA-binding SARP family transcriptional activator
VSGCLEPAGGHPELEVAVLGPVEFRGAAEPFTRSAAKDLVVYLALHRNGVRNDVWGAALWPDRCAAPSTLHSTASAARRALGQSRRGGDHLPRGGRHLRLADSVGTDVERFARAAAGGDPACWREALGLVRGRLFDGLCLTDWTVLEGAQAELESMVSETALKGAEHFLRIGLGEEAEWMIRRGLRVSPYDERLYRALVRAAELKGNRSGLRSAMAELLSLAAEGRGHVGSASTGRDRPRTRSSIHPSTVALYRELAREGIPAAGGDSVRL